MNFQSPCKLPTSSWKNLPLGNPNYASNLGVELAYIWKVYYFPSKALPNKMDGKCVYKK
jgi:hypothetical protein